MEYEITGTYKISDTFGISVATNGLFFSVYYIFHTKTVGVIAIPDYGVSIEAGAPDDLIGNMKELSAVSDMDVRNAAGPIAKAIKKHWEELRE